MGSERAFAMRAPVPLFLDERWGLAAVLFDPVARGKMSGRVLFERRLFDLAAIERDRTARVKAASGRRIHRRGNIARQHDALAPFLYRRIGYRHG